MLRPTRAGSLFSVVLFGAFVVAAATSVAVAQDDDTEKGTIVLKVDGKEVEILTTNCYLLNTDSGYADGYEFGGEGVFFSGSFDLNGDNEYGDEDKVEYDEDEENVVAASLVNKNASVTPTAENPVSKITIPGLGECEIISGTLSATAYKPNRSDTEDHWSGDIELTVRTPAGEEKTLSGTFDSGIVGVW